MHNQSDNVHTNHVIVDDKIESAKERCEIMALKEDPASVTNISTKLVTNNQKARWKSSKTCGSFTIRPSSRSWQLW